MVLTAITGFLASPLGKGVIGAVGSLFKKKGKKKATTGGTGRNLFKSPILLDGMANIVRPSNLKKNDTSNTSAPQTLFLTAEQQKMRPGAAGFQTTNQNTGFGGGLVTRSFYNDPAPESGKHFSIPGSNLLAGMIASMCPSCTPEQVQMYANLGAGGIYAFLAYKLFGK